MVSLESTFPNLDICIFLLGFSGTGHQEDILLFKNIQQNGSHHDTVDLEGSFIFFIVAFLEHGAGVRRFIQCRYKRDDFPFMPFMEQFGLLVEVTGLDALGEPKVDSPDGEPDFSKL